MTNRNGPPDGEGRPPTGPANVEKVDTTPHTYNRQPTTQPRQGAADTFQPMPELTPEQWDALAADILANGVLVPVIKDQHGRILDGNNRAAIADKLGIDYPVTVVEVADDDDAWDRAVSLNCARRHLSREQTRELVRSEIQRRPEQSDRAIARRVGCSPSTVGAVRAEVNAEQQRLADAAAAEKRRQAEELTRQIEDQINNTRGRIAMRALLSHRDGQSWQTVGDVLERSIRGQLSELANDDGDPDPDDFWHLVWGPFFDGIRAYDCEPDCTICTPEDRAWRDSHPKQVYRWAEEVSKLDTEGDAVTAADCDGGVVI